MAAETQKLGARLFQQARFFGIIRYCFREKCVLHHKCFSYLHQTNTVVFLDSLCHLPIQISLGKVHDRVPRFLIGSPYKHHFYECNIRENVLFCNKDHFSMMPKMFQPFALAYYYSRANCRSIDQESEGRLNKRC